MFRRMSTHLGEKSAGCHVGKRFKFVLQGFGAIPQRWHYHRTPTCTGSHRLPAYNAENAIHLHLFLQTLICCKTESYGDHRSFCFTMEAELIQSRTYFKCLNGSCRTTPVVTRRMREGAAVRSNVSATTRSRRSGESSSIHIDACALVQSGLVFWS